jgi:2-amino-4-hydroxy-6-hydroxymethyldihydropteridine diphosphokinase
MHKGVIIAVGSNLGDSIKLIKQAYELIEKKVGTITAKSSFYETPPWGFESYNKFINSVIEITTELEAYDLLTELKSIEKTLGRQEKKKKGYESRIIDLDIIDFEGEIINSERLVLPHKNMHERLFVLIPLHEVNSSWKHSVSGDYVVDLIKRLPADPSIFRLT